jgi:hypothetical protein
VEAGIHTSMWRRGKTPPPDYLLIISSQVHCISTEFTPRKHGGEKGVPFRVQIDTFKQNENGEYTEHLHSASCQIKVFKVRRHGLALAHICLQRHHKVDPCNCCQRPSQEHSICLAQGSCAWTAGLPCPAEVSPSLWHLLCFPQKLWVLCISTFVRMMGFAHFLSAPSPQHFIGTCKFSHLHSL